MPLLLCGSRSRFGSLVPNRKQRVLTGLSLEVDLAGVELAHAGEAREQGADVKKAS